MRSHSPTLSSLVRAVLLTESHGILEADDPDSPAAENAARAVPKASAGSEWYEPLLQRMNQGRSPLDDVTPLDERGRTQRELFLADNETFIRKLDSEHGSGSVPFKMIGMGYQGHVWQLPDGKIMKIFGVPNYERAFNHAQSDIQRQRAEDPDTSSALRVFDVFKLQMNSVENRALASSPTYFLVAVIMERVSPADKGVRTSRAMRDLLGVVAREVHAACLPFVKQRKKASYVKLIQSDIRLEKLRMDGFGPREILGKGRNRIDCVPIADVHQALEAVAQDFLKRVDDAISKSESASRALLTLPEAVEQEMHIRLKVGGSGERIWWSHLKDLIAYEIRRGGWDIVPDNFGINAKGYIIPFDM